MKNILFLLLLATGAQIYSQETSEETSKHDSVQIIQNVTATNMLSDCGALFMLNDRKMDNIKKRPYIYSPPYYERIFNSKRDYGVFQLGRRKGSKPFLYVKLFPFNTCIKQNEVVEIIFTNGYRYRLENIYEPNCAGIFISELTRKNIKQLTMGRMGSVKVFTFEKDYEFHFSWEEAERMRNELQCIFKRFKYK